MLYIGSNHPSLFVVWHCFNLKTLLIQWSWLVFEPPNDRTVVSLDATSDVYVVVYTWNSDSGETIFDGQVSLSRLELAVFCCEVTEVCLLYTLVEDQYVSMNMDIAATDQ